MRRVVIALALLIVLAPPALAHGVNVFATAEGRTIKGFAYFSGGERLPGAKVAIHGPDKAVLGETITDDNGAFAFEASRRMDHVVVVNTGDGHAASFVVRAVQLPESLPEGGRLAQGPGAAGAEPADHDEHDHELEEMVEEAVARQIGPLREQLVAYEAKVRWHDVLGGVGYILGLFGIAFYVAGRRKGRGDG